MNRTINQPAATVRLVQQAVTNRTGMTYRHVSVASRPLFATPPVDLTTLVIAQEIKRKAQQAELQRDALRDTAYQYEMPVSPQRNDEDGGWTHPTDVDLDE